RAPEPAERAGIGGLEPGRSPPIPPRRTTMSNVDTRSEKAPVSQAPVAAAAASSAPTEWTLDPVHTEVGFKVRHMMVSWTRGSFGKFEGKVHFDESKPESLSMEVKIETSSIDTKAADRDNHLRSGDFFDAENHPHMIFK